MVGEREVVGEGEVVGRGCAVVGTVMEVTKESVRVEEPTGGEEGLMVEAPRGAPGGCDSGRFRSMGAPKMAKRLGQSQYHLPHG